MKPFTSCALFAASAVAHTIFQELSVKGVSQGHLTGVRAVSYDGPIMDVTTNDIICNTAANTFVTPYPPPAVIPVAAGDQVSTEWHHTLTSKGTDDKADPVDPSHSGPTIAYLAKVDDPMTTDVTGLKWFKIFQDGLDSSGKWGVDRMISNGGKVNFNIPKCVPSGTYLLRAEIIALHGAGSYPGAQFYVGCAQLNITGGGNANPATVSFPGAYKGSDPGITFQLWYPKPTSYTVPGPDVFECT